MTYPDNKFYPGPGCETPPGFSDFSGFYTSWWVFQNFDCRQEISDLLPQDYGIFLLSPEQAAAADAGYIRKRRLTQSYTLANKFKMSTVSASDFADIVNPALGPITLYGGGNPPVPFTGYVDDVAWSYNYEGSFCDISVTLLYQTAWYLINSIGYP